MFNQQEFLIKQKDILETFENDSKTISMVLNGLMQIVELNIQPNTEIIIIEEEIPKLFQKGYFEMALKIQELYKKMI